MKRSLSVLCFLLLAVAPLAAAPAKAPSRPAAGVIGDIQLTRVRLEDVARLLSQVGQANVVVTSEVFDKVVSIYLRNARVEDMVRNVCRAAGVWYRKDGDSDTYIIMSAAEYQKDLAIVRDEKTRVFTLRHHNVVATANAVRALFGSRVALAAPVEEMPPVSLGSGNRQKAGSRNTGNGNGNRSGNNGNNSGTATGTADNSGFTASGNSGGLQGGSRGGGASAAVGDPRSELDRLSAERLSTQIRVDEQGQLIAGAGSVQEVSAHLGPPINVTYNRLNNLLMVRSGDLAALDQIGQLIAEMDRPPKQVLLEMKILEVTLDDGYRSVFDIGLAGKGTTAGPGGWASQSNQGTGISARNSLGSGLFGVENDANLIWQVMSSSLTMRLQLLANENKLKVLSSPMLVAANNQPARLFIGDERVLTVGASSQSVTGTTGATNTTITVETEKRDVGQTLAILPRINGDRTISLTIDQDSSTVKIGDATIPITTANGNVIYFPIDTVNTANLQVTAHAKDGMTVAIGGMIRESSQRDEEKVPLLGDIPGVGFFFKRDVRAAIRSQIVLLITPRVLESPEESASLARQHEQDYGKQSAKFPRTPVLPKPLAAQAESAPVAASGYDLKLPAEAPSSEARSTRQRIAELARAAAHAVREEPVATPVGMQRVSLGSKTLALDERLEASPVASWQADGLRVTALRVINLADHARRLSAGMLRGRWTAMVIEQPNLDAAFGKNSWSWVYAISEEPFEQALEHTP